MVEENVKLTSRDIEIPVNDDGKIKAVLNVVGRARGIIIFAHGSSRFSPRNKYVANELQRRDFATLLLDLSDFEVIRAYPNNPLYCGRLQSPILSLSGQNRPRRSFNYACGDFAPTPWPRAFRTAS